MRLLLVLLAMLSGLSLPQAAAVAAARSEVTGSGLAQGSQAVAEAKREACPVRAREAVAMRRFVAQQRKPIWLPVAALAAGCAYELSDRARQ